MFVAAMFSQSVTQSPYRSAAVHAFGHKSALAAGLFFQSIYSLPMVLSGREDIKGRICLYPFDRIVSFFLSPGGRRKAVSHCHNLTLRICSACAEVIKRSFPYIALVVASGGGMLFLPSPVMNTLNFYNSHTWTSLKTTIPERIPSLDFGLFVRPRMVPRYLSPVTFSLVHSKCFFIFVRYLV